MDLHIYPNFFGYQLVILWPIGIKQSCDSKQCRKLDAEKCMLPEAAFTVFPKINNCFLYVFKSQLFVWCQGWIFSSFYSSLQCHMILLVCLIDPNFLKYWKIYIFFIESCILQIHSQMLIQSETGFALKHNVYSTASHGAFFLAEQKHTKKNNNNNVTRII